MVCDGCGGLVSGVVFGSAADHDVGGGPPEIAVGNQV